MKATSIIPGCLRLSMVLAIVLAAGAINSAKAQHATYAGDPQVQDREMLVKLPAPDGEHSATVTGIPIRMSATPLKLERAIPKLGEHNEEIYCGILGFTPEDLVKLKADGTI